MVEEGGRVTCSVPAHADRLVPPRLTGTGNVLTSRIVTRNVTLASSLSRCCRLRSLHAAHLFIRARHKSYWDARYVRCKALRRALQCATPGAEDEQRAAWGQNFISRREPPVSRVSDTVTMSRRHGVMCHASHSQ